MMSTERPHHFKKESLQPLTLYTSFHDLINVYSRGSGADNPKGHDFDVVTSVIWYKFQKHLVEDFFMILYMYIAQGQGLRTP